MNRSDALSNIHFNPQPPTVTPPPVRNVRVELNKSILEETKQNYIVGGFKPTPLKKYDPQNGLGIFTKEIGVKKNV